MFTPIRQRHFYVREKRALRGQNFNSGNENVFFIFNWLALTVVETLVDAVVAGVGQAWRDRASSLRKSTALEFYHLRSRGQKSPAEDV